jgi:hypothetical protein
MYPFKKPIRIFLDSGGAAAGRLILIPGAEDRGIICEFPQIRSVRGGSENSVEFLPEGFFGFPDIRLQVLEFLLQGARQ